MLSFYLKPWISATEYYLNFLQSMSAETSLTTTTLPTSNSSSDLARFAKSTLEFSDLSADNFAKLFFYQLNASNMDETIRACHKLSKINMEIVKKSIGIMEQVVDKQWEMTERATTEFVTCLANAKEGKNAEHLENFQNDMLMKSHTVTKENIQSMETLIQPVGALLVAAKTSSADWMNETLSTMIERKAA